LLDGGAVAALTLGDEDHSDVGIGLLALGTWPLSLTANGMWHAFPDSSLARGWALGMVTASDVALLSYDALLLSRARRAGAGLAAAESFIGALQLGFGVVTAFRSDPSDRVWVWSMTAIPAALCTHGVLSLALPRAEDSQSSRSPVPSQLARLPRFGLAPLPGGLMMQAVGRF
jgi:hypothetical protein